MAVYILRYDGIERFAEGDAIPTKNKVMALLKPLDERDDVDIFARNIGVFDTVKYVVTDTTAEIWERQPGKFEGLTIVLLEKVQEKTDGTE